MTLEIIGAGFGRTGTHSLKNAIEILDFGPTHHMYEVRKSSEQISVWSNIANGQKPDWMAVFSGFRSQVDWPGSRYWKELAANFPLSKVILTTRDPEAWYESIRKTILPSSTIGRNSDPDPVGRAGSELIYQIVTEDIFGGRLDDKDYALEVYEHHRREVVETIPADRLLVFDVKDGWAPLCKFLGAAIPEVPFPSGNTIAEFRAKKPYLGPSEA
jgi:hypothetical protein